jgi:hypothetical protein
VPWLATMDVRSRSTPWENARVEVAPVLGLVKHTSVQNQSPAIIARWISQVFAAAPTPPRCQNVALSSRVSNGVV